MKILLLTYEYPPFKGGVANYLEPLVKDAPPDFDVTVEVPPVDESWIMTTGRMLKKALLRHYDFIVISHVIPAGYAAWVIRVLTGTPYVVIAHGTDILTARKSFRKRLLMRFVLRNAKFSVGNSRFTAALLHEEGATRIKVVPPSVNVDLSKSESERRDHQIISIGRLVERKGFDVGIKAISIIKKTIPDVRYIIVGKGRCQKALNDEIIAGKLEENIKIITDADDATKNALLSQSAIFVLPAKPVGSEIEGFGIVTLEAQAAGLPVIVSNSGGSAEAIVDGLTGIIVAANDPNAIAHAVLGLFSEPAKAKKMGDAGREYVRGEYSRKKAVDAFWDSLYFGKEKMLK